MDKIRKYFLSFEEDIIKKYGKEYGKRLMDTFSELNDKELKTLYAFISASSFISWFKDDIENNGLTYPFIYNEIERFGSSLEKVGLEILNKNKNIKFANVSDEYKDLKIKE